MGKLARGQCAGHRRRLSKPSTRVHAPGRNCELMPRLLLLALLGLMGWTSVRGQGTDAPVDFRTLLQDVVTGDGNERSCDPGASAGGVTNDCPRMSLAAPKTSVAGAGAVLGAVVGVLLMIGLVVVGTGYYYYKKDPEKFFDKYRNIFRRLKKESPQADPVNLGNSGQQLLYAPQLPTEVPVRAPGQRPLLVPVPASMQGGNQMAGPAPWQNYQPPEAWSHVAPPRVVPPVSVQGTHTGPSNSSSNRVPDSQGVAITPQASMPAQQPVGATAWPQEYPGSLPVPYPPSLSNFRGSDVVTLSTPVQQPPLEAAPQEGHRDRDSTQHFQPLNYDIRVRPISNRPTALGAGAFGTVEAGVFTDENGKHVQVAVKYGTGLSATKKPFEVAEIFRQELDVMRRVPVHPNIVLCYGGRVNFKPEDHIGERDVYIVEELMHSNLHEVIHGDEFQGRMPFSLILKIALDIASGLEHLHQASVMHYDLKPANILVDENFRNAKIADFGISIVKAFSYITGTMRGTIGYMAPEVLLSHFMRNMLINEKIDVYSMGVVLWEMVEGKSPSNPLSNGNEPVEAHNSAASLAEDRFLITRPCPEPLKRLVDDCVSLEGGDRPTAREARQRLHDLISANKNWTGSSPGVDG